jgi:hypothetical protein
MATTSSNATVAWSKLGRRAQTNRSVPTKPAEIASRGIALFMRPSFYGTQIANQPTKQTSIPISSGTFNPRDPENTAARGAALLYVQNQELLSRLVSSPYVVSR